MKTHTLLCLLAIMPLAATGQEPPPDMPLPPMKKDERVVKAQQETKAERQKREAAEANARKVKAENDELKRQLAETKKQAAPADAAKVSRGDAMPVGANAGTTNYTPLSVFRDKFSNGSLGPEMVVIPAGELLRPMQFQEHKVERGETSYLIAHKYGQKISDLRIWNEWEGRAEYGLHPGDFIKVKPGQTMTITVKQNFALGKTEVTQSQWRHVMGSNPSKLKFRGCDDCPVESVSWDDVQGFIKKLNVLTGRTYRLPLESEWEYAAGAGSSSNYAGGNDIDAVAWYYDNSGDQTHPVGQKKANAWGLYDMTGNVFEWVEDCWNESYEGNRPNSEQAMTSEKCSQRVRRGGAYGYPRVVARSDARSWNDASNRYSTLGFRLARMLP